MEKRTVEDVEKAIASLTAEADQLKAKAEANEITPEETARFEQVLAELEKLQEELKLSKVEERYSKLKERTDSEPSRPTPMFVREQEVNDSEKLNMWGYSLSGASPSNSDHYKCRTLGFNYGDRSIKLDTDWNLNHRKRYLNRTILSKGGSNTVDDYIVAGFSNNLVKFMLYESPFIGTLNSETVPDGNLTYFFKFDNTAMKATYTSASGGTETVPTIPEANFVSSRVSILPADITTGYQKASFNVLRDSRVKLEPLIVESASVSFARQIEDQVINATGNGANGSPQGLLAAASSADPIDSSDMMVGLEDMYYSIPIQYRKDAIWVVSEAVAKLIRQNLLDDTGRSLFDKNAVDGVEWDVLLGKRFYVSQYMTEDEVLFFDPNYYKLVTVRGSELTFFPDKFYPNQAWASIMSFNGAWLGPTTAIYKADVQISS